MTHFLQRTALIALATSALGACSTTEPDLRPSYPVRAPEAAPPPAPETAAPSPPPAAGEAPIASAPPPTVEQRSLEPLSPAAPAPSPPPPPPPPPPLPPPPPPKAAVPAQPTYRTVTTRSVTGKVVDVEGSAVTYRVRKGDTLEEIAGKLGTTVRQLREDNDIGRREKIHPGDVIKGPRRKAKAYVAGAGDTLYSIGRRFGVSADDLRDENDLARNASLRAGQRIRLPAGFRDRGPLTTTSRVPVSGAGAAPADETTSEIEETPAPGRRASQPAEAGYRTVTSRSVIGKVVEVAGPAATYKVKRGDNLEKIARKLDTTVEQLRDDNGIRRHEAIQPGQVLKGPRTTAKAYVAGSGDTLSSIGKRFGVTAEALRQENGLSRNAAVRSGQRIRLPDGYRDRGPLTTTTRVPVAPPPPPPPPPPPTPTSPRPYAPPTAAPPPPPYTPSPVQPRPYTPPSASPRPYTPPAPSPYTPPTSTPRPYTPPAAAPVASPPPSESQISELGRGRFIWPLQGHVISDFGPKGTGQRNDGVNIAASLGASVRSAAAGDVVYAGDQVPGFGNLVLIKHADGWVTAYGHLSVVSVKMQQKVTQGQEIGQAGATGGVAEPQLHFEIRYASSPLERAKPIDPKLVLPK